MPTKRPCIWCRKIRLRFIVIGVGMMAPVAILFLLLSLGVSIEGAIVTAEWLAVPWFMILYGVYVWLISSAPVEGLLQDPYRLIFFSDENFFNQFALTGASYPNTLTVSPATTEKDATRLGFDFSNAVSFVACISGTMNIIVLATKFLDWLSPTSELIIQCPNGESIKIIGSNKISAEKLAEFIRLCHKES
jgi:hypothetical protein